MRTMIFLTCVSFAGYISLRDRADDARIPQTIAPCQNSADDGGVEAMCLVALSPIKVEYLARAE